MYETVSALGLFHNMVMIATDYCWIMGSRFPQVAHSLSRVPA